MKRSISIILALLCTSGAFAQENKPQIKLYGFIRNYYALDTRESISGTEEFFYYTPKDVLEGSEGEDLNEHVNYRFAALTSRLGVDVLGYEFKGWKMGAKIEADFYNGLAKTSNEPSGASVSGTALFRLRQAYATVSNGIWSFKAGQAWHPMAADMPDVFSLNSGSPFGPFSRTPLVSMDVKLAEGLSLTAATIWQMQYQSTGPYGASAIYMRNGGYELYGGLNYTTGGLLLRAGVDVLSIVPRYTVGDKKVNERLTTVSPFFYAQYKNGNFTAKFKTIYAQAGEHLGLNGGYGVKEVNSDGSYEYTPSMNSSSWLSLQYAANSWQYILFGGYSKNFGTKDKLAAGLIGDLIGKPIGYWFSKNSYTDGRLDSMWRITPTVIKNFGRLSLGLECEITSASYGDVSKGMNLEKGLYDKGIHSVTNYRVQGLLKFTF